MKKTCKYANRILKEIKLIKKDYKDIFKATLPVLFLLRNQMILQRLKYHFQLQIKVYTKDKNLRN